MEKSIKLVKTIFTNNLLINLQIFIKCPHHMEEFMLSVRDLLRKYIVLLGQHNLVRKTVKMSLNSEDK